MIAAPNRNHYDHAVLTMEIDEEDKDEDDDDNGDDKVVNDQELDDIALNDHITTFMTQLTATTKATARGISRRFVFIVTGAVVLIVSCLALLVTSDGSSNGTSTTVIGSEISVAADAHTASPPLSPTIGTAPPAMPTDAVRACTLNECFASNCNNDVAPYVCLFHNGGPHGGCSSIEWITPDTCTEQCNLSGCDDMEIPSDAPSCAENKCDRKWCHDGSCSGDASFTCMEGSARFGCSADELEWTIRTANTTCSSCCNMALC